MDEKDLRSAVLELWQGSGKISRVKATGRSMEPLIKEGDKVIIRHSGVPEFGDIILYDGSDGPVIHRVIGKRINKGQKYIIEKGDSSSVTNIIPLEKVMGIVVGIENNEKIIHLDTTLSKIIGKAMALYSLLSHKILSRYELKSFLFSYPRKVLTWILKSSKG